ncbi:MAG: preprotein translocase subunit SecY, partial [Pseudomonadota bacterium]
MTSAAEQFASNINLASFAKAEELKKRLLFTLGALIVYRLGTYIPIPGINPEAFAQQFQQQQGGLLGTLNIFAGGAVERMAIFALNIMPYISASIIMTLMTAVIPSLEAIKKEGEQGRRQINQYTRYLTVFLATMQGYFIAVSLQSPAAAGGIPVVTSPGVFFIVTTVVTLVGGVMFLLWLGEQITARGVGNGVSLIIFAGIVAELPRAAAGLFALGRGTAAGGQTLPGGVVVLVMAIALALIAFVVFVERSQRRLLVQYPRRQVG